MSCGPGELSGHSEFKDRPSSDISPTLTVRTTQEKTCRYDSGRTLTLENCIPWSKSAASSSEEQVMDSPCDPFSKYLCVIYYQNIRSLGNKLNSLFLCDLNDIDIVT